MIASVKNLAQTIQSSEDRIELSDPLTDAYLGSGLPRVAEEQLRLAGDAYHNDGAALAHLQSAQAAAPEHPAVLIGFYRFYFYKNRLQEALAVASECLRRAAKDNGFAEDWRLVKRSDADFDRFDAVLPRFFLFTLKGYAYLNMRLGRLEEGRSALQKLQDLDRNDRLGGKVLIEVLERYERGDED